MTTRGLSTVARSVAIAVCAALSLSPSGTLAGCSAQSPAHAVALVELYTSEGCDSCPPADRWLSQLGAPSDRVAALGLHVDYWDRLGWKDRFASAAYTARQYQQMGRQRSAFVFTPQVLLQGRDFGQWRSAAGATAAIAAVNARAAGAMIELAVERDEREARVDLHVVVPDPRSRAGARVDVALTQDSLTSEVKAGENAGKRLSHNHVVRQWRDGIAVSADGEAKDRVIFPLPAETGPLTVVAFVEDARSGDVLQALALPLCAKP